LLRDQPLAPTSAGTINIGAAGATLSARSAFAHAAAARDGLDTARWSIRAPAFPRRRFRRRPRRFPPAAAQPPHVQTPQEALAQDAAEYARNVGVTQEEAERRLRAQAESVPVTDAIRSTYGPRLAGISIEHKPVFRIRVLLTGSAPVADRVISAGGMRVPIVFQTGARVTAQQVIAAMYRHREAIRAIVAHDGMGHDPRTGALVVMADPATWAASDAASGGGADRGGDGRAGAHPHPRRAERGFRQPRRRAAGRRQSAGREALFLHDRLRGDRRRARPAS
jgi:hypothetical protein